MKSHFHPAMAVEEELYGDAILTALPERLIKSAGLPLYKRIPGLEPRGALWVEVMVGDTPVQIINTHLGLVPQEQKRQAAALIGERWMASDAWTAPGVLLGDFNASPYSATYRMLKAAMRDAQTPSGGLDQAGDLDLPLQLPVHAHRPRLPDQGSGDGQRALALRFPSQGRPPTTCRWWSIWRSRLQVIRQRRRRRCQANQIPLEALAAAPGPPGVVGRDRVAQAPVGDELLHAGQAAHRHGL
jgi:hypothetical protein